MVLQRPAHRRHAGNRPLSEGLNARSISHRRSSISERPRDASSPSAPPANVELNGKTRAPKLGGGLAAAAGSPSESLEEYDDAYAKRLHGDELDAYMTKWQDIHRERLDNLRLDYQEAPDERIQTSIDAEEGILQTIQTFLDYIQANRDGASGDETTSGESTSPETTEREESDRDADGSYNPDEPCIADVEMTDAVQTSIDGTEEAPLNSDEIEGLREIDQASGESSDEEVGNDAEMDYDMDPANTIMFDDNAANREVENPDRDDDNQQIEGTEQEESGQDESSQRTTPAQASTYSTTLKVDYETNFPDPEELFVSSIMVRVDEIQKLDWDLEQFRAPPLETQDFASITFREKAMAAYAERELRRQDIYRIIENGEAYEQESMLAPVYKYNQLFDRFEYYCAVDFEDKQSAMMYGYEVPAASHALQALPVLGPDHKAFWEGGKTMLLDINWYLDEIHSGYSLDLEAHIYRDLYEWGSGKVPELIVAQRCLEEIKREAAACRHASREKTMQVLSDYQEQCQRAHELAMREGHYALTGIIPYVRPYESTLLPFDKKEEAKEIKRES